jgi:hypothetical protein
MRLIGVGTVILYMASLAFFLAAMFKVEWVVVAGGIGLALFVAATLILAVMIKKRAPASGN